MVSARLCVNRAELSPLAGPRKVQMVDMNERFVSGTPEGTIHGDECDRQQTKPLLWLSPLRQSPLASPREQVAANWFKCVAVVKIHVMGNFDEVGTNLDHV